MRSCGDVWSECLPPRQEFILRPWPETYGTDYYGALHVAARYCGLRDVPSPVPGVWQHGVVAPWEQVHPETAVFLAPRSYRCFVGRRDEVTYLKEAGYRQVRAAGLPMLYTHAMATQRLKASLLVLPPHSLPTNQAPPSVSRYVEQIAAMRDRFETVVACISSNCFAKGYWVDEFRAFDIPVIQGAGINDANALFRMRKLFETFEYVTTNSFGSHVAYALYFGGKVSIWGDDTPLVRENIVCDGTWSDLPDAVERLLSEETKIKKEEFLMRFFLSPWLGIEDRDTGAWLLGEENKLSPSALRKAFGWTSTGLRMDKYRRTLRASHGWRILRSAAIVLRNVLGNS